MCKDYKLDFMHVNEIHEQKLLEVPFSFDNNLSVWPIKTRLTTVFLMQSDGKLYRGLTIISPHPYNNIVIRLA